MLESFSGVRRAGGYCANPESLDAPNEFRKACKTMTGVAKVTVIQCINVVGSVVCGHSGAPVAVSLLSDNVLRRALQFRTRLCPVR